MVAMRTQVPAPGPTGAWAASGRRAALSRGVRTKDMDAVKAGRGTVRFVTLAASRGHAVFPEAQDAGGGEGLAKLLLDGVDATHFAVLAGAIEGNERGVEGAEPTVLGDDLLLEVSGDFVDVVLALQIGALLRGTTAYVSERELRGHIEEQIEMGPGDAIARELDVLEPGGECTLRLLAGDFRGLIREVGIEIAVGQDQAAFIERLPNRGDGRSAIAGEERGNEPGVNLSERSELAAQEHGDGFAIAAFGDPWKADVADGRAFGFEPFIE